MKLKKQRAVVRKQVPHAGFTVTLKPLCSALIAALVIVNTEASFAQVSLPQGASVVHGQASLSSSGRSMQITTGSERTVIDWQSFSVGNGNGVHFQQPNSTSRVLNRVQGQAPSNILGSLSSNGSVWLINPNGILFGREARVNVAGLVASTLDM